MKEDDPNQKRWMTSKSHRIDAKDWKKMILIVVRPNTILGTERSMNSCMQIIFLWLIAFLSYEITMHFQTSDCSEMSIPTDAQFDFNWRTTPRSIRAAALFLPSCQGLRLHATIAEHWRLLGVNKLHYSIKISYKLVQINLKLMSKQLKLLTFPTIRYQTYGIWILWNMFCNTQFGYSVFLMFFLVRQKLWS